ncbi:MAG: CcmD family protein [Chitinophagaceae bacterium]
MKKSAKIFFLLLTGILSIGRLAAQGGETSGGLDQTMRSSGRIYVVVAVMLTILAGLIIYLIRLDRKITRLEKE